ncbi:MAG TPA: VapE domain-containing protein [Flavipsychrobacter sp.]|nr:VapE domain-containing protein [Flavipsychrobacter sp.]
MTKKTDKKKPAKDADNKKAPKHDQTTAYSFKKMEEYLESWYSFRYNEVTNEIEYRHKSKDEWKNFDEMELNGLYVEYRKDNIKFSKNDLAALIFNPSIQRFNPFQDYFDNLPKWDGKDYIREMAGHVQVMEKSENSKAEQERFYVQFKKMLIRTLACAIRDNYFNKHIFILYGAKQNQYKSSFIRYLVPTALKKYYSENFNSDKDKDSAISLCENFMINIDELASLAKYDLNKLKATLSRLHEKLRLPFAKRATLMPRRVSFWGTTNEETFLTDVTGNVRWICFHVLKISDSYNKVDIDQLWSQVLSLYQDETEMNITLDEIKENEEANARHQVMTAEMELIQKYFSPGSQEKNSAFYTSTDIVDHLSKLVSVSIRLNSVAMGRAMTYMGFIREQKLSEGKKYPEKGYYVDCSCKNCEIEKQNQLSMINALN